jgi:hypothetical protein
MEIECGGRRANRFDPPPNGEIIKSCNPLAFSFKRSCYFAKFQRNIWGKISTNNN